MTAVAKVEHAPPFPKAARALKDLLGAELEATNETIIDHLSSQVALIPEVARHLISAGGKRLRPLVALAAAEICGGDRGKARFLAGAVELIHAATLLHDDVVDDSKLRRGLETANVVFGNKESVLVGDFLFARSFELMVETGSLGVLRILSHAASKIAEGEVLQLTTEADLATSHDIYLQVIGAKTAALFAAAAEATGVLSGADAERAERLRRYGYHFGIAFQMVDDTLDYMSSGETIGKTAGDDFREGKMTLPVIYAMSKARDAEERAFWMRTVGERNQREGDFQRARDLISRDGIVGKCLKEAGEHADTAVEALSDFPPSQVRDALVDLALSSIGRAS